MIRRGKELSPIQVMIYSGITAVAVLSLLVPNGWSPRADAQTIPGGTIPIPTATEENTLPPTPQPDSATLRCQIDIVAIEDGKIVPGRVSITDDRGVVSQAGGIQSFVLVPGETDINVGSNAHSEEVVGEGNPSTYQIEFITDPQRLPPGFESGCDPDADPVIVQTSEEAPDGSITIEVPVQNGVTSASADNKVDLETISLSRGANGESVVSYKTNAGSVSVEGAKTSSFSQKGDIAEAQITGQGVVRYIQASGSEIAVEVTNNGKVTLNGGVIYVNDTPVIDTDNNGIIEQEEQDAQIAPTPKEYEILLPFIRN